MMELQVEEQSTLQSPWMWMQGPLSVRPHGEPTAGVRANRADPEAAWVRVRAEFSGDPKKNLLQGEAREAVLNFLAIGIHLAHTVRVRPRSARVPLCTRRRHPKRAGLSAKE